MTVLQGYNSLKWCLGYPAEKYVQGPHHGHKEMGRKYVVKGGKGKPKWFYAGLLPRVLSHLRKEGHSVTLEGELERLPPLKSPSISGKILRADQLDLLGRIFNVQRGLLVAPMGSGKTVLAMGVLSAYPGAEVLYLCPTVALVTQTVDEFCQNGFSSVIGWTGGGRSEKGKIVVSTVQSYIQMYKDPLKILEKPLKYFRKSLIFLFSIGNVSIELILWVLITSIMMMDRAKEESEILEKRLDDFNASWDIVIVDEIHKMAGAEGQLSKVLRRVAAPVRVGFTATLPKEPEKRLNLEGLIGPVLGELGRKEAIELGIIAEPRVKLIPLPALREVANLDSYAAQYRHGIVQNDVRNRAAARQAKWIADGYGPALVFAFELDHVRRIASALEEEGIKWNTEGGYVIVDGSTPKGIREMYRKGIEEGRFRVGVSSLVWREGVNIPSLGGVVLAAGWKDSVSMLQWAGRALRRTDGKTFAWIVDFLDPYRYLAEHSVQRISLFIREGWLK